MSGDLRTTVLEHLERLGATLDRIEQKLDVFAMTQLKEREIIREFAQQARSERKES